MHQMLFVHIYVFNHQIFSDEWDIIQMQKIMLQEMPFCRLKNIPFELT